MSKYFIYRKSICYACQGRGYESVQFFGRCPCPACEGKGANLILVPFNPEPSPIANIVTALVAVAVLGLVIYKEVRDATSQPNKCILRGFNRREDQANGAECESVDSVVIT